MGSSLLAGSRSTIYPLAVVIALAIGVFLGSAGAERSDEAYGGDYPAFYGAGRIAAEGDWDRLYELDRQIEVQRDLHPDADEPAAWFFAYPPQVALAYQPLAGLDYYPSYLLHTAIMGLLLWLSLLIARPMLPWLRGRVTLAMAVCLVFWPVFRTVTGGSNTALTIFLIVAAWRLVHDDRQLAAGLVLAGLLYKPQFAVPMIGLYLLGRYFRVVQGAAIGAAVFYLSGAVLRGWGWLAEWVEVAADFGAVDAEINGHSAISFVGFAENLFGVGSSVPVLVAYGLAAATVGLLSWIWWRSQGAGLDRLLAISMPGILLLSLHAMSHDGAVVVITAGVAVAWWPRPRWLPWIVVIWVLGASQSLISLIGWSPGFPMLLLTLGLGWRLLESTRFRQSDLLRQGAR